MTELSTITALVPNYTTNLRPLHSAAARNYLECFGQADRMLTAAQTNLRFELGRLLIAIQEQRLYRSPSLGEHGSMSQFMGESFGEVSGMSERSGWDAMMLTRCRALAQLPESERGQIHLTNARMLAKIEAELENGEAITPEVIEAAKTESVRKFANSLLRKGAMVQTWVRDKALADPLHRLLRFLSGLTPEAAEALADFFDDPDLLKRTGESPDDRAMLVMATVGEEFANEEAWITANLQSEGISPGEAWAVFKRQQWRCARCDRIVPLQRHHIVYRSRGGGDEESNLEGLCQVCHGKEHGR